MASRRSFRRQRGHQFRPRLLALEDRTVLSTIMWNTAVAPTGGDWDTASDWVGGVVPGPGDDVSINVVQDPATVILSSNVARSVHSLSMGDGAGLDIVGGTLNLGAGPSTIGVFLNIEPSASMTGRIYRRLIRKRAA